MAPRLLVLIAALVGGVGLESAQDPDDTALFEVASIKPTRFDRPLDSAEEANWKFVRGSYGSGRGRFYDRQIPAMAIIQMAYDVWSHQIHGAPDWVRSARYEIDLRTGDARAPEQMRPMMRRLLADRFNLRLRQETRAMTVFELVRSAGGLKFAPMREGDCFTLGPGSPAPQPAPPPAPMPPICGAGRNVVMSMTPRVTQIEGVGVRMPDLIRRLEPEVGRVIVDRTAFTEEFIYRVAFAPSNVSIEAAGAAGAPSIGQALKEQLGLELKSTQGAVDVLTIEHIERPTPN